MLQEAPSERRTVNVPEELLSRMVRLQEREHRSKQIRFYLLIVAIALPSLIYAISMMKLLGSNEDNGDTYASLVRIEGPIDAESEASAQSVLPSLEAAFKDEKSKGVVLLINSPGGTPVQAGVIHDRILSLKAKYKKPVVAVGRDAMTSGAYMVAVAADTIYANEATLVGSVGVIIRSFGVSDVMARLGVERRVYAAGRNKNGMDPFLPERADDVEKTKTMLSTIHEQFISKVKAGRGARLKGSEDEMFSGEYWTADKALLMGLIDGIADMPSILKEQMGGAETVKDFSKRDFFGELTRKLAGQFSMSLRMEPASSFIY